MFYADLHITNLVHLKSRIYIIIKTSIFLLISFVATLGTTLNTVTTITRNPSGNDVALITDFSSSIINNVTRCSLSCRNGVESLVVDTDNNTIRCMKNKWFVKPSNRCSIQIQAKKSNYDAMPTLNLTSSYNLQTLYESHGTKRLFPFPAICQLLSKCLYIQVISNRTMWKCWNASDYVILRRGTDSTILKFSNRSEELTGEMVKLELHCFYSFGSTLKSVNSCLLFKVIGTRKISNQTWSGICNKTQNDRYVTVNNDEEIPDDEVYGKLQRMSAMMVAVIVVIVIVIGIACIIVGIVIRRKRQRCSRNKQKTADVQRNMLQNIKGSNDSLYLVRNDCGDMVVYDRVMPSQNRRHTTQQDNEYLQPVDYAKLHDYKNIQPEHNEYELLHPSHYQTCDGQYELMLGHVVSSDKTHEATS